MDSLKKLSANVFSKKPEPETTSDKPSTSFSNYIYVVVILVFVALAYYFRDQLYSLYEVYVADSVRRVFGETMLKMHLTPNGEFVSTYVPNLASLGKMVGISNAETGGAEPSLQEIGLDSIGL
jgi:hypothetical protein